MRKIVVTKTALKFDKVEYLDNDRLLARIDNPKQRILPHDLIHAIIESTLGVRGFTDDVFDGAYAARSMKTDDQAWLSEAMVEAIQGMLWSGHLDLNQFNSWVASICSQRDVPAIHTNASKFENLTKQIEKISESWDALDVGESFELIYRG